MIGMCDDRPIKVVCEEYCNNEWYLIIKDESLNIADFIYLRKNLIEQCIRFFHTMFPNQDRPYCSASLDYNSVLISKAHRHEIEDLVRFLVPNKYQGRKLDFKVSKFTTVFKNALLWSSALVIPSLLFTIFMIIRTI